MFKKASQLVRRALSKRALASPCIIPRPKHTISREKISKAALKVLYRLKDEGHCAYLVGGGVRDILLGRDPKDFDVVTDAHPETLRNIFRNSRIIGRRFRLVHVYFDSEVVEVSTFRANVSDQAQLEIDDDTGMIFRDNTYGTIEEDAWRRDFTVNALYYNIADFSVVDYMHGMQDLKKQLIRIIGDPAQRYHEDCVRLLRALRLAAKLNFHLEVKTEAALKQLSHLLQHVPPARLFDEFLKLFFEGHSQKTYAMLNQYHYFLALFPQTVFALSKHKSALHEKIIRYALKATDERLHDHQSVNPGFLLSVFLWPALQQKLFSQKKNSSGKEKFYFQLHQFIQEILHKQLTTLMIPKRFQFVIQAIWILQFQLERRRVSRIFSTFQHRYFRAAFDFMALRIQAGDNSQRDCFMWWKAFQEAMPPMQEKMIAELKRKS